MANLQGADSLSALEQYKRRGNEAHAKEGYKEAQKLYTKALTLTVDPEEKGILRSNRSATLLALLKYDDALADAEACIALRPNWIKGYFRKAEVLRAQRKWREALAQYQLALQKDASRTIESRVLEMEVELENVEMGIYVRQLLPGRDICLKTLNPIQSLVYQFARGMKNFIYLVGDIGTREAYVVDCCWDYSGIVKAAKEDGYKIVGAIATHYHFDHTGGKPPPPYDKYPVTVDGMHTVAKKIANSKVYVGPGDYKTLHEVNGVPAANLVSTDEGQELRLGRTVFKFIQTPGHTPGSQCVLVNGKRLLTGDTLFIGSCGRLDFPDADASAMYASMQKLRALPDHVVAYPGHNYGGYLTTIGQEKRSGVLAPMAWSDWQQRFTQPR